MPTFPKVVLYARASGPDAPEDQLGPLRARCLQTGWAHISEYVDRGHETSQREQMLADARSRKFDVVLFSHLNKFCEDGFSATVDLLDELNGCGVEWTALVEEGLEACHTLRRLLQLAGRKGEKKTCHSSKSLS